MRRIALIALGTAGLCVAAVPAHADEIRVPKDARTLKKALSRAQPGDTILLSKAPQRGVVTVRTPDIVIQGVGTVLRGKRAGRSVLRIRADGVTVRDLHLVDGAIAVDGDRVTLDDIGMKGIGQGTAISVRGDDARIENSSIGTTVYRGADRNVIDVQGADATIVGNTFKRASLRKAKDGPRGAFAVVHVTGHDAEVRSNTLTNGRGACAFHVVGDRAEVRDNEASQCPDGVLVEGDAAQVTGNTVRDGFGIAIELIGDDHVASENTLEGRSGDGITFRGERPTADGNSLSMGAYTIPNPTIVKTQRIKTESGTRWQKVSIPWDVTPGCPAVAVVDNTTGATISNNHIEHTIGTGVHVRADDVVIEDNVFVATEMAAQAVEAEGDDLVITGNTMSVNDLGSVHVVGNGTVVEDNDFAGGISGDAVITLEGDEVAVRDNEVLAPFDRGLHVDGDEAFVDSNVFQVPGTIDDDGANVVLIEGRRTQLVRNRLVPYDDQEIQEGLVGFVVDGSESLVAENVVEPIASDDYRVQRYGIIVHGNDQVIRDNVVLEPRGSGMYITGDDSLICDNVIAQTPGPRGGGYSDGIQLRGDRNRVERNEIASSWDDGIVVLGDGNLITDTVIVDTKSTGIYVSGDHNQVLRSSISDPYQDGILIVGDDNLVEDAFVDGGTRFGLNVRGSDNEMCDVLVRAPASGGWGGGTAGACIEGNGNHFEDVRIDGSATHGVVVRGVSNHFEQVTAADSGESGFRLEEGFLNTLENCVATGNGLCGLENLVSSTTVMQGTFRGNNDVDVLTKERWDLFNVSDVGSIQNDF